MKMPPQTTPKAYRLRLPLFSSIFGGVVPSVLVIIALFIHVHDLWRRVLDWDGGWGRCRDRGLQLSVNAGSSAHSSRGCSGRRGCGGSSGRGGVAIDAQALLVLIIAV